MVNYRQKILLTVFLPLDSSEPLSGKLLSEELRLIE